MNIRREDLDPRLKDFSDEFLLKSKTDPMTCMVVECTRQGISPYRLLEEVVKSNNELLEKITEIQQAEYFKPQRFVISVEDFKNLKDGLSPA